MAFSLGWIVLVCCGVIIAGEELNSTAWPCNAITPLEGVTVNALIGTWFLVETIQLLPNPNPRRCSGIILSGNTTQNLVKSGFSFPQPNGGIEFENFTLAAISPSVWDEPDVGLTTVVVDLTNSSLVLSSCFRSFEYQWTGVFGRQREMDVDQLDGIHQRLNGAEIAYVSSAVREETMHCRSSEE
ncbi:uncharacterized protein [Anabrus simplex]|uniref:uncharacterized protein n=1 Tax=Anabrus simplex TaxID=316456 RepID=UPI0035A382D8